MYIISTCMEVNMNCCMVEIAFDDMEIVKKVLSELLNKKLIAGGQVVNSYSKWNWHGEMEMSEEYLLFIKTKKVLLDEIKNVVEKYHNYECFEFAVFDLSSPNKDYLDWIESETKTR